MRSHSPLPITHSPCPIPHAPCPMPHAPLPQHGKILAKMDLYYA
ncbi:hypothetical protein [Tolypothrix sp. VBCCA 56010]